MSAQPGQPPMMPPQQGQEPQQPGTPEELQNREADRILQELLGGGDPR